MGILSWYPVPKTTGIAGTSTSTSTGTSTGISTGTEALVVLVQNTRKTISGFSILEIPKYQNRYIPGFGKSTDNQYSYQ
jgi:hypothetical protein